MNRTIFAAAILSSISVFSHSFAGEDPAYKPFDPSKGFTSDDKYNEIMCGVLGADEEFNMSYFNDRAGHFILDAITIYNYCEEKFGIEPPNLVD